MAQTIYCDVPGCAIPAGMLQTNLDNGDTSSRCWEHYLVTIRAMVEAVMEDERNAPGAEPDAEEGAEPTEPVAEPAEPAEPAAPPQEPATAPEPEEGTPNPAPEPATAGRAVRASRATATAQV
jgi:hypothetical protein